MPRLKENEIRLLSLRDDDVGKEIQLSSEHICALPSSRNASQSYLALSYSWGTDRSIVNCDGKPVEVSTNLVSALPHIHRNFPGRFIWTDSLCIQQHDLEEKSHQVSVMGRIFASAEAVVVWLGEDPDEIADSLDHLTTDLPDAEATTAARRKLLTSLSTLSWFYRAWCFQEIRLAREAIVLLGSRMMRWEEFIGKVQRLRAMEPNFSTIPIRSQPQSYSRHNYIPQDRFFSSLDELNAGDTNDLAELLFLTWYREASDKRDKVYSLLSSELFHSATNAIPIDYEIDWNALCIRTARACINSASKLKILRVAGMTQRRKSPMTGQWDASELPYLLEHPSWVADWWHPPQQTRSVSSFAVDDRGCLSELDFCCPPSAPVQDLNDMSPFLVLKGVLLGLFNVGDPPTFSGGFTLIHPPPHCASTCTVDFITRPNSGDSGKSTIEGVAKPLMPLFMHDVQKHLERDCTCVPFNERKSGHGTTLNSPHAKQFETMSGRSGLHFGHQSFALTSHGPAAPKTESEWPAQLIAASVESGDWLVLLEGGGTPFILRPAKHITGGLIDVQHFKSMARDHAAAARIPDDAGCFVLVGEASMCWDELWPRQWDTYCKALNFVLV